MPLPGFKQFKFFGFSDVGKVRKHNEDSYLCNEKARLFLVADGMGGHASGETASQMAISRVEEYMTRSRAEEARPPIIPATALPGETGVWPSCSAAHALYSRMTKNTPETMDGVQEK